MPELPPSVGLPNPVACRFEAHEWSGTLHLTADGPAVADVTGAFDVRVTVPQGAANGAVVDLSLLGLQLRASLSPADLKLFAKRAIVVDDTSIPNGRTPLRLTEFSSGKARISLPCNARIQWLRARGAATLHCEDLSLEEQAFDPADVVGNRDLPAAPWLGNARVQLRLDPGGPPVAWLDTRPKMSPDFDDDDPEPDQVLLLAARGAYRQILWTLENGAVVGWVHAKFLGPPESFGMIGLLNIGAAGDPSAPLSFGVNDPTMARNGDASPTCAWNAPLVASIGSTARIIGTIASGVPVTLGRKHAGLREIGIEHPALSIPESTTLWVPESLLYPCDFASSPEPTSRS